MQNDNLKFKIILLGMLFFGIFGWAKSSWAATINAASCSFADVSAAVNSATAGDTIIIPAGACTWGANLLDLPRGMNIIGAGAGKTVIVSSGQNIQYHPNSTAAANNERVRISGFTFNCSANSVINIYSQNSTIMMTDNRVDHNIFNNCSQTIFFSGNIIGLVDNNSFIDAASHWGLSVRIDGREWYSWDRFPLQLGTGMSVYVEDNIWKWTSVVNQMCTLMDCGEGGRYVFRHNTIDLTNVTVGCYPFLDAHGNQAVVDYAACPNCTTGESSCCYSDRGTLGVEVYDNTITANIPINLLDLRGGIGIIFNNTIIDLGSHPADWFYWRMREEDGCVRFDSVNTYPAYDQVKDSYFWNNKANGIDNVISVDDDSGNPGCAGGKENTSAFFIQKDRDYFLASPVGKIVNGTVYTPYAYPHPLRVGADTTPPAAPTGLAVN